MLDEDTKYSIESEIDKAFPYLDKLDEELKQLKDTIEDKRTLQQIPTKDQHEKFNFFNIFLPRKPEKEIVKIIDKPLKLRKKTLQYHNYSKDGYIFRIQLIKKYDDISIKYYEFSVNITFNNLIKKDQYYKKFNDMDKAKQYYTDMDGVFKNLKRRDLIERLFREKIQEIESYKGFL